MLAGYLQNGESIIIKRAAILWNDWATAEKINYKFVSEVHDEYQTEVNDSYDAACRIGELQCKAIEQAGKDLNLFCPLSGEFRIGKDWSQTH